MTTLSDQIKAIRERAEKATKVGGEKELREAFTLWWNETFEGESLGRNRAYQSWFEGGRQQEVRNEPAIASARTDVPRLCRLVEKMLKDLDQVGRAYIKTQGGTESQYLETVRKRDARYARILSPRGENDKEGK